MTKYNAVLLRKYDPTPCSNGNKRYAGKFLVTNTEMPRPKELTASQFKNPIPVEVGDEFILEVNQNGKWNNIKQEISYTKEPFPSKREHFYEITLDANGWDDPDSGHIHLPEHPYAHVKVNRITYGNISTIYKVTEIHDEDITTPEIYNAFPTIGTIDDATPKWLRVQEALRDYLPIKEHPEKQYYSATEIFRCYRECTEMRGIESTKVPFQYDSDRNHCICKHYIEELCYCEYMSPRGPDGIQLLPLGAIGNCCIKQMAWETGLYTRTLSDIVRNYKRGTFEIDRDVSKKNGFGDRQMQFLKHCVLTPAEYGTLEPLVESKCMDSLSRSEKRIIYRIVRFYETHYDFVFDADKYYKIKH